MNKNIDNLFSDDHLVKSYIKQNVTFYFGQPTVISSDKLLKERFREFLSKPFIRNNSVNINEAGMFHPQQISTKIREDDFPRYGWELSPRDIIAFGKTMEQQVQFLLRNMGSFHMTFMIGREDVLTC